MVLVSFRSSLKSDLAWVNRSWRYSSNSLSLFCRAQKKVTFLPFCFRIMCDLVLSKYKQTAAKSTHPVTGGELAVPWVLLDQFLHFLPCWGQGYFTGFLQQLVEHFLALFRQSFNVLSKELLLGLTLKPLNQVPPAVLPQGLASFTPLGICIANLWRRLVLLTPCSLFDATQYSLQTKGLSITLPCQPAEPWSAVLPPLSCAAHAASHAPSEKLIMSAQLPSDVHGCWPQHAPGFSRSRRSSSSDSWWRKHATDLRGKSEGFKESHRDLMRQESKERIIGL